ncbi:MAG TPA: ABC transporter ATP-binding protein [Candidatus Bathyarchaeia archaeon]|nr:ABC transporter ATP-binding protein [Candidatus Bathyarchaeia archaeon]
MFFSSCATGYYRLLSRIYNTAKQVRPLPINFQKSWWSVFLIRKWAWFFLLCNIMAIYAFNTLIPLLVGWVITQQKLYLLCFFFTIWVFLELFRFFTYYTHHYLSQQAQYSVLYGAYRIFFTVDPLFHSNKSTGRTFGKMERAIRALDDFMIYFLYDILPIITGTITVATSFFIINFQLGIIALTLLLTLIFLNISGVIFNGYIFEPRIVQALDTLNALTVEGITQISLVRASFATNDWLERIKKSGNTATNITMLYTIGYLIILFLVHGLYIISIGIISYYIMTMIKNNTVTLAQGISFVVTYIYGTWEITKIGRRTQKCTQAVIRIADLFNFIRTFGKQTFPVLIADTAGKHLVESMPLNTLTLKAEQISFSYTHTHPILDHHTLSLEISRTASNKLYGIIGPSGIGKTTLLSILGGQLKPTAGSIFINNTSIYDIDDNARRQLLALQGQVATTFSGTVRHNLLLGIFHHTAAAYHDAFLIDLLKKVGLWHIFSEREELNTQLGEGGLSLSVGQRQRLNFAALYLRAHCFKPSVILIDEPTSSLDELSEDAITAMMEELARHAITIVIAHRLHTLEEAIGILDCSLLSADKHLTFYTREDLMKYSDYYKKLIKGEVPLDE